MDIVLMELKLQNFKGISNFVLETSGKNISIYGQNATGKTTLIDAFMWLLFDKDSTDKKDFNIKTLNAYGEAIHGLEHEVSAVLMIDEKPLTLRKVYAEKWTKKRGESDKQLTGHTTDYFINDVPVKKSDYISQISKIADEETFKLLTNVLYFNENLHWTKRRELLIEVCGDISDEDVIASDKSLKELSNVLNNHSMDEHRAMIKASLKRLNKEIEKIPIRIDEVNLSKPDISNISFKQVNANKQKLEEHNESLQEQINQLKVDDGKSEKKKRIAELNEQLHDISINAQRSIEKELAQAQKELSQSEFEFQRKLYESNGLQERINKCQDNIAITEKAIISLRKHFIDKQQEQAPELNTDSVCPTCNQEIPAWQIEEAHRQHIANFNTSKAKELIEINAKGAKLAKEKEQFVTELKDYEAKMKQVKEEAASIRDKNSKLVKSINTIKAKYHEIELSKEYTEIVKQIEVLEAELESNQDNSQERIQELQMLIDTNKQAIKDMAETLAKEQQVKQADDRIKELMAEEKKLSKEYAQLEKQDFLCETFIKRKVELLEDKINSKFNLARFKMFEEQINGGIKEVCETTFNGVPYSDLNNGMKINIGLDVIRTLSEHYNMHFPLFVDNAESVTQLLDAGSQMIRLVVSEPDKQLRVEAQ